MSMNFISYRTFKVDREVVADDDAVVFKQCFLRFPSAESKRRCKPAETIYDTVARYRIGIGIEMQRVSDGATCARTTA